MIPSAVLGLAAAFAFVLGLLFLTFRVLGGLPALTRRHQEGPELRVLARTALSPKQGLATVKVGDRVLVVGYGDGGVRAVSELEEVAVPSESEAPSPMRWAEVESDPESTSPTSESSVEVRPSGAPIPFRQALGRAIRSVRILGLAVLLGTAILASPAHAAPADPDTAAAATVLDAPSALPQSQEAGARTGGIQLPSIDLTVEGAGEDDLTLSGPVGTVLFVGFLTLLPTLLLLMTSFTRILVVLHLLKQALGTQTAPPGHLVSAMALLLTGFVMAPVLQTANETAVQPWLDGRMDELAMVKTASLPFREFMLSSVREEDLAAFMEMSNTPPVETTAEIPLVVLSTAFVTSELRAAFQMGFALFLPFVIIDVVVASVLMSMGMFMLPPVMVSLPFKLLLFVLVDGWALVMGSLVKSFA